MSDIYLMISNEDYVELKDSGSSLCDLLDQISQGTTPFSKIIILESEARYICIHGDLLYIGEKSGIVHIYSFERKEEISKFSIEEDQLFAMIASPTNVTTIGSSLYLKTWDLQGTLISSYDQVHTSKITNLLMHEDNMYISDIAGNLIKVSNTCKLIQAHTGKISCLQARKCIASGSHDRTISIWNSDLDRMGKLQSTRMVHRVCFISDILLASAGTNSLFCVWDLNAYTLSHLVMSEDNWVRCLIVCPAQSFLITGTNDGFVKYWDLKCTSTESEETFTAHESSITNIIRNETGSILVTSSKDKTVKIWQVSRDLEKQKVLEGHEDVIECLLVDKDEGFLYSAGRDNLIAKWDLDSFERLCWLKGHSQTVTGLAFADEDLLSISEDRFLKVWKKELLTKNIGLGEYLLSLCVTKSYIFIGSRSGSIYTLDRSYTHVKVLTGHWNTVSSLIANSTVLFSASHDRNIKIWNLATLEETSSFKAHDSSIRKIYFHPKGDQIVSIGSDKLIKIWYPGNPPYGLILTGHKFAISALSFTHNGSYLYSADKSGKLLGWCSSEFVNIINEECTGVINDIATTKRKNFIIAAVDNKIHVKSDLFNEKKMFTFPNSQSFIFFHYLSGMVQGKSLPFKELFKDYLVLPHRVNILHVMAYVNDFEGIKLALRGNVKFITSSGKNPLRIALDKGSYQCIDVILKYVPIMKKTTNPNILNTIENEILDLLVFYLRNLPLVFVEAFPIIKAKGLPVFGDLKCTKIQVSEKMNIIPGDFLITEGANNAIEFHNSLFKIPLEIGSSDCIRLLHNIEKCENSQIFDTFLIQSILNHLFAQSYTILILMSLVNLLSISFLILYAQALQDQIFFTICIIIVNIFNLLIEFLQIFQDFSYYASDIWNIVDLLRIVTSIVAIALKLCEAHEETFRNTLSMAIFFSMLRMISLFRLYSGTRYMIRMVFEVINDISSFLLVLLMTTMTISVSFYFALEEKGDFFQLFTYGYLMNFGQFDSSDVDGYNWYVWGLFIFSLFLNPLVMMNLLIATMGDTYSRIQSSLVISNYKEIASLILEASDLLFWKKKINQKMYLQTCSQKEHSAYMDNISLKLKKMKIEVDRITQIGVSNGKKIDLILKKIKE